MTDPVPHHQSGSETNTEDSVSLPDQKSAQDFFRVVKERLFAINSWHEYAGKLTADFQLTDSDGNPVDRHPEKGDYFQISIPAPGSESGEGSDWVRIEQIVDENSEHSQQAAIRVRPAASPINTRQDVAHFFSDDATSSFIVKRDKNKVTAGVYGRNEKPNTNTETLKDKVRNIAVATGAISGFSKLQWKSLVSGLLNKKG